MLLQGEYRVVCYVCLCVSVQDGESHGRYQQNTQLSAATRHDSSVGGYSTGMHSLSVRGCNSALVDAAHPRCIQCGRIQLRYAFLVRCIAQVRGRADLHQRPTQAAAQQVP